MLPQQLYLRILYVNALRNASWPPLSLWQSSDLGSQALVVTEIVIAGHISQAVVFVAL